MADRPHQEQIHHPASGGVDRRQHTRHFQHSAHPGTHLEVNLRQHPGRGALVHVELTGDTGERAGDLHAAGPGADERDPFAADVIGVVPVVGPHHPATELGDALDRNIGFGVDVTADRGDQETSRDGASVADLQAPQRGIVIPHLTHNLGVGPQVGIDALADGDIAQVAVNLRAGGEQSRPTRVARKRKLVPQRRDVDGQAGVVVVAPGSAHVAGTFEDDEIVDPIAPQQVRGGDSTRAGADNRDLVDGFGGVWGHRRSGHGQTLRARALRMAVNSPPQRCELL